MYIQVYSCTAKVGRCEREREREREGEGKRGRGEWGRWLTRGRSGWLLLALNCKVWCESVAERERERGGERERVRE